MCVYKIKVNFKLQANLGKVFKRMKAKAFLVLNQKKIPKRSPKFSNMIRSVLNKTLNKLRDVFHWTFLFVCLTFLCVFYRTTTKAQKFNKSNFCQSGYI